MTAPAGDQPGSGGGKEPEPAPSYPKLVRVAGRWLCRHELAALASTEQPRLRP